jgi:hypothetical protein
MTRQEKLDWMTSWCAKHGVALELEGECEFGRECVGVLSGDVYPDYEWYDSDWDRADGNGDVWTPHNAYHKHPCVAVLGRGEDAEDQLYQWLRWFDENNFVVEVTPAECPPCGFSGLERLLGKHENRRMVRKQ